MNGLLNGLESVNNMGNLLYQKIYDYIAHGMINGKDIPYPEYDKQSTCGMVDMFFEEARADLENMLDDYKRQEELSFYNTGSGLWGNSNNGKLAIYEAWIAKWVGEIT